MIGFWALAEEDPSHLAVVTAQGEKISAGTLLHESNRLVRGLRATGMKVGDTVGVAMQSSPAFLEVFMAAGQAGWYFAPFNAKSTASELAKILADANLGALIFDSSTQQAVEGALAVSHFPAAKSYLLGGGSGFRSFESLKDGQSGTRPDDRLAGETLMYTTGTTGAPRAILRQLHHAPPETRAQRAAAHLRGVIGLSPRSGAVHLVCSPLSHSASLLWCTDQLHLGHSVVLMGKWTPEGALQRIDDHRVTTSLMVPTHFHRLLLLPQTVRDNYKLSSLKQVVHGGAPCPVETKRRMLQWWGPVIHEVYGSAEGGATHVGPAEWLAHPGTVGLGGRKVSVLREDGSPCAPGEVGTVYLKTSFVDFVYRGDPSKTASARRGNQFTVGDMGYLDAEGYLFLCDRKSDMIISGGINIFPSEVEAVLRSDPRVVDVAVIGTPDDEWGEQVRAIVEVPTVDPSHVEMLASELIAICRQKLSAHKCPRSIEFTESLPRDDNGKLLKRKLREPYWVDRKRQI